METGTEGEGRPAEGPDPKPDPKSDPGPGGRPGRGLLAPFAVRSFRFQWGSDVTTSSGFEMENLILGWYVLVQTGSPFLLSVAAALQYGGTLLAPGLGVVADRVSRRTMLLCLRGMYAAIAATAAGLGLAGWLEPWHAFVIAGLGGFLRPLDMMIRFSLLADTIPPRLLMNASGFQRLTMDAPRIVGALAGAGIMAAFGVGAAYAGVAAFYLLATLIGLGISPPPLGDRRPEAASGGAGASEASGPAGPRGSAAARFAAEFGRGVAYIRSSGVIRYVLFLAVLANLLAYPSILGLLPVVAKVVYGVDENGLAQLLAALAAGALLASTVAALARLRPPAAVMAGGLAAWLGLMAVFAFTESHTSGMAVLFVIGFAQSLAMIAMGAVLLMVTAPAYRGRVMGVRMIAVYGMPLGLLAGGALIEWVGVRFQIAAFAVAGLALLGLAVAVTRGRWLGAAATRAGGGSPPLVPAPRRER